jgi:hypothetical protein
MGYGEKDTAYEKLLQRTAHISVVVTYFARNLSNAPCNWHESVRSSADGRFWLFYPY